MVPYLPNYVIFTGKNGIIFVSRRDIKYLAKVETVDQDTFKLLINLPPKLGRSYSVEVQETLSYIESLISDVNQPWWKFWA